MSITDSELFELAGPGPFERGYDYYREGQVVDLEIRSDGIVAYVSGTDLYRVSLRHDGVEINGSCDCPASDGIGFCKHCVAAALELRDQLADGALTATSQHDTGLETYLMRQDAKTLSTHLLQVLHRDPVLYERLRQQAELAEGMQDAALLKKAITRVTPLQDVFGSAKVRAYFRRLETVLEGILEIADQVPAEDLLKTAVHGIKRLNKALERLDDSGGYREHAQARLRELHRNALRRIDWTPQRRAKHLLEQALADPWDQYEATPFDYSDALGEAGLSAFYAIVEKRFVGLPVPSKRASFEDRMPFLRLRGYLMMRAREQDDVDELIRLKKLTASTGADFDNIARLYLQKGDPESASRWLCLIEEAGKRYGHLCTRRWVTGTRQLRRRRLRSSVMRATRNIKNSWISPGKQGAPRKCAMQSRSFLIRKTRRFHGVMSAVPGHWPEFRKTVWIGRGSKKRRWRGFVIRIGCCRRLDGS
jgi:uncharacterized Zn finger protein